MEEKESMKTQLNFHKLKAKAFYGEIHAQNQGEIVLSFDSQKKPDYIKNSRPGCILLASNVQVQFYNMSRLI